MNDYIIYIYMIIYIYIFIVIYDRYDFVMFISHFIYQIPIDSPKNCSPIPSEIDHIFVGKSSADQCYTHLKGPSLKRLSQDIVIYHV